MTTVRWWRRQVTVTLNVWEWRALWCICALNALAFVLWLAGLS